MAVRRIRLGSAANFLFSYLRLGMVTIRVAGLESLALCLEPDRPFGPNVVWLGVRPNGRGFQLPAVSSQES